MAWHLKGSYFETCNCNVACPCVFLSPPTEGECRVLVAWHVDDGKDGEVDLSDLNVAMAIHSPGHMMETKWRAALYLDERASDAQKQALTRIFAGQAGGHLEALGSFVGDVLGVASVRIDYQALGKKRSLAIPDVASAEIEAIEGQGGGDVTISGHPLCVAPGEPAVVAKSKRLDYTDHHMTWAISDGNGFYSPFAYRGG
ncbi:MAG: DUF1326 domain-containing protein [Geminicoccaceae bacterium]